MGASAELSGPRVVGRYALYGEIASGGMATVHFGRLIGPVGFSRTVAVKRLHPHHAKDPEFVSMFLDEARLAARIHHPNVVQTLDVVALDGELFLVLDYVQGEALAKLIRSSEPDRQLIPLDIVSAIVCGALLGLHAAHEATDERGEALHIVHRDVSPQNILVGADGVPRVLDFGVAKARGRVQTTREGQLKGKLAYMAPEQLNGKSVDRRTDVYAAGVLLWESLTLRRLFGGESEADTFRRVLLGDFQPPSAFVPGLPEGFDAIIARALAQEPADRFDTALDMALAIEKVAPMASATRVGEWLKGLAGGPLALRAKVVAQIESESSGRGYVTLTRSSDEEPTRTAATIDSLESRGRNRYARRVAALGGLGAVIAILCIMFLSPARRTNPKIAPGAEASATVKTIPPEVDTPEGPAPQALPEPSATQPPGSPAEASALPGPSASAPPNDSPRTIAPDHRMVPVGLRAVPASRLPKAPVKRPEALDPLDTSH